MNRAMVLTPAGGGAIAVVRLVGPAVGGWLQVHFSRPVVEGRAVHGKLAAGERVIDDPVVVLGPGEEYADLNLHGGPWVVRSVLELAAREGFEIVEEMPGPAPLDAVDGQTLLEREIAAYLPLARTELALRVLLRQAEAWKRFLKDRVDAERISKILRDRSLAWLLSPPRVAIIGVPNVGKSTLANQLFAQERSITADLPGTTRDWVGEIANVDGLAVMLLDTPGLHQTADPIERMAIERSGEEIRRADLVLLVLDATQTLEGSQAALLEAQPDAIRVINKCDRPAAWAISRIDGIQTVGMTGAGISAVRRAIRSHFGCDAMDLMQPRCWTARQKEILQRGLEDSTALHDLTDG